MTERTLKEIRSALTEKTIDILAGYRKAFSGSHPPGQLVLPENLKELSMYILGLLKCRAFKGEPASSSISASSGSARGPRISIRWPAAVAALSDTIPTSTTNLTSWL